ncbi:NAD(P)H-hydrate dehydratase [Opitutaceae bacterium EW11]|nr:NAD(P)H-hydrate dehydratase [Opitutaceae bacterium EW11]
MDLVAHPVLTSDAAKEFEAGRFGGNPEAEWRAMWAAGAAVGRSVLWDFSEIGPWPSAARVLVLVGKGHNGGDALLAAQTLLAAHVDAVADLLLVFGERSLRPLTLRAYQSLVHSAPSRVRLVRDRGSLAGGYDVAIDGVFGFQFRPPIDPAVRELFARLEAAPIRFRAAVDLPSGLGDAAACRVDFTYATGSVKAPTLDRELLSKVGRLRYLDLGFFDEPEAEIASPERVLSPKILAPLQGWRPPVSDKRHYGHLFVVGGSRSFPGAVMMSVQAALRAGVGLLTAFVPESLVPAYAAQVPEAMWVGCPETPDGGLALEGLHLLRERSHRATALAIGPGLTQAREPLTFAAEIVSHLSLPTVIDADALQPEVVMACAKPRVLTPHAGEFKRLAGEQSLSAYAEAAGVVTVLKGVPTRISNGASTFVSLAGGPVLSRGGSGDLLTGIVGGLLAQHPSEPVWAACAGVLWHGKAADSLARSRGPVAVRTTELLEHLGAVLRKEEEP